MPASWPTDWASWIASNALSSLNRLLNRTRARISSWGSSGVEVSVDLGRGCPAGDHDLGRDVGGLGLGMTSRTGSVLPSPTKSTLAWVNSNRLVSRSSVPFTSFSPPPMIGFAAVPPTVTSDAISISRPRPRTKIWFCAFTVMSSRSWNGEAAAAGSSGRDGSAATTVDLLHLDLDHAGRHLLRDADVGALDGDRPLEQGIVERSGQAQQRVDLRRGKVDLNKLRVAGADADIEGLGVGRIDIDRAGSLHRAAAGRASGELVDGQALAVAAQLHDDLADHRARRLILVAAIGDGGVPAKLRIGERAAGVEVDVQPPLRPVAGGGEQVVEGRQLDIAAKRAR